MEDWFAWNFVLHKKVLTFQEISTHRQTGTVDARIKQL